MSSYSMNVSNNIQEHSNIPFHIKKATLVPVVSDISTDLEPTKQENKVVSKIETNITTDLQSQRQIG
ncbi:hypothetical protein Hanom_Chr11g01039381 [Helianthus anomalus]